LSLHDLWIIYFDTPFDQTLKKKWKINTSNNN
jgi:hypothetical protein